MNQAESAHSLLVELQRLRSEGVRDIYVEEESLLLLEGALRENFGKPSESKDAIEKEDVQSPSSVNQNLQAEEAKSPKAGNSSVRAFAEDPNSTIPEPPAFELPDGSKEERWAWLRDKVLECPTCQSELNPGAKVVFVPVMTAVALCPLVLPSAVGPSCLADSIPLLATDRTSACAKLCLAKRHSCASSPMKRQI